MSSIKQDFPIFQHHPELVYLDSTATSQKPSHVIDGVTEYLSSSYANIHRGSYEISEISEKLYEESKKIVAKNIGAESWKEVIYTGNSTYALNFLAQSIWRTGVLKKGDKVLVSIVEHHANIVPWLILKQDYGIEVEYVAVTEDYTLDFDDFRSKLDDNVKVVSIAHVSNTTGQIFDVDRVNEVLDEVYMSSWDEVEGSSVEALMRIQRLDSSPKDSEWHNYKKKRPLFIVDGSQSIPHFEVDVKKIWCDALFFTGHKIFADSGIGVLWAKETLLNELKPICSGGGAIGYVKEEEFTHSSKLPDKFDPGTPNLSGAVSLLKAFEYIESIGGYKELERIEHELVSYALEKFMTHPEIKIMGGTNSDTRVWVFTFYVEWVHSFDISDYLADYHICIRAGQHCAEPFMSHESQKHTCRMSLHIYNTKEDIDRFFEILEKAIRDLK